MNSSLGFSFLKIEFSIQKENKQAFFDISNFPKDETAHEASVKDLMVLSKQEWESRSTDILNKKMIEYVERFGSEGLCETMAGFFERHDLDPGSEVAVIGDIHGNSERLELTLNKLQNLQFLDENYQCLPGKTILFLGDYVDRGTNSLKVLELVVSLKKENPNDVHLLRGNHEDLETSNGKLLYYAALDEKYLAYMENSENRAILNKFYKNLPVCISIAQQRASNKRAYGVFCHGLFHLYTDPVPLFQIPGKAVRMWVYESSSFSQRICQLMQPPRDNETEKTKKLRAAAEKLRQLEAKMDQVRFNDIYWLDVASEFTYNEVNGRTYIDTETVEAYLEVCSTESSETKELFRAHQNHVGTLCNKNGKVVVTTIDPSTDSENQVFLTIKLAEKVKDWQKTWVAFSL